MEPIETLHGIEVVKRGETSLTVTLVRSAGGLTVYAKAHPAVEAFIRGLGTGETADVKTSGPYWRPAGPEKDKPLLIYTLTEMVPPVSLDNGVVATITKPGQPLVYTVDAPSPLGKFTQGINLSFLRIVGISENAGICFSVRGVHTLEAVENMKKLLGEGYKRFYQQYLKPFKVDIIVSTQTTYLPGDATTTVTNT